ncbi:MAG: hypothetical protein ABI581_10725 [Sediminibacterium sp.]
MTNFLPYALFFSLVIIAGIIIGFRRYRKAKNKVTTGRVIELKQNGKKIMIELSQCSILHREYYDESESGEKIKQDISIVTYSGIDNFLYKSQPVYLSEWKLRGYLVDQKQTLIYIDTVNPENYYFDLEFIIQYMLTADI